MERRLALLAVLGTLGCASDPTSRWDIDSMTEQEAPRAVGTKHPAEEVAPAQVVARAEPAPEEGVYGADPVAIDAPAPLDTDASEIADGIVQGSYPPPQSAPPPPQGNPPPKVVYVQQPPPNVVYVQQPPPPPPPPFARTRVTLKGGYYSVDDTKRLDDGYIIEATFMNFFSPNFATELELGYLEADGKDAGVKTDLWGIPFLLNARFCIPLKQKIELYGGGGIGSIYYDISAHPGSSADGWVAAADAFFGASLMLKNGIVVGVESKYFFTESVSSLHDGLDSYALMLTLGWAR